MIVDACTMIAVFNTLMLNNSYSCHAGFAQMHTLMIRSLWSEKISNILRNFIYILNKSIGSKKKGVMSIDAMLHLKPEVV